jgi:hypothetical protein
VAGSVKVALARRTRATQLNVVVRFIAFLKQLSATSRSLTPSRGTVSGISEYFDLVRLFVKRPTKLNAMRLWRTLS